MARRIAFVVVTFLAACAGAPPAPERTPAPAPPGKTAVADEPEPPAAPSTEVGGREYVRQLQAADENASAAERFREKSATLRAIRALADPRGADGLHDYVNAGPASGITRGEHVHFQTEAALALAELGDVRAIPLLARRLELDPLSVYDDSPEQLGLKRDDQERVFAARLLADLGTLHPEISSDARQAAAKGLSAWLKDRTEPHANALRARVRLHIDDPAAAKELLAWADPKTPLPKKGEQPPFRSEFAVAQSALRYLGASKHDKAIEILKRQLRRRPKNFDGTMDGLMLQGNALLGMTLRALATGAAQGFAELGDARATPWLLAYIDEDRENEQSRSEACQALAWVIPDRDSNELAKRLNATGKSKLRTGEVRLACLLDGLVLRTPDALLPNLLALVLDPLSDPLVAGRAARALGRHGLDPTTESALLARLDGERSEEAAVAIALGGSSNAIAALAKRIGSAKGSWPTNVTSGYSEAVKTTYADDLASGRFFRWIENASTLATAKHELASDALRQRYLESEYDAGPRSLTRVVLRARLYEIARGGGADKKRAVQALTLLRERGILLALGEKTD